ncbi:MAG: hypothetical protein GEV03_26095 [Streptosporangiales bacterium]|nr:hypothetical protein [Streptosporangiales bacterium]
MRHLVGLILGIVLAPVLLYGAAWGSSHVLQAAARLAVNRETVLGIGALLLVGVVVGALTSMRWLSPVGALVAGLFYLGLTVAFLADFRVVGDLFPRGVLVLSFIGTGGVALLGAILVVSAMSPTRWRPVRVAAEPDPGYLQPPPMPQFGSQPWAQDPAPPGGFSDASAPRPPETPRGDYPGIR